MWGKSSPKNRDLTWDKHAKRRLKQVLKVSRPADEAVDLNILYAQQI